MNYKEAFDKIAVIDSLLLNQLENYRFSDSGNIADHPNEYTEDGLHYLAGQMIRHNLNDADTISMIDTMRETIRKHKAKGLNEYQFGINVYANYTVTIEAHSEQEAEKIAENMQSTEVKERGHLKAIETDHIVQL